MLKVWIWLGVMTDETFLGQCNDMSAIKKWYEMSCDSCEFGVRVLATDARAQVQLEISEDVEILSSDN